MSGNSGGSQDEYSFPRRINDPILIFIFPAKQLIPSLLVLIIAAYGGHFWLGLLISASIWFTVGSVLKNSYFDVLIHRLWSKGLLDMMVGLEKTQTVVNPLIKRFFN
jgi:hypothetical protein